MNEATLDRWMTMRMLTPEVGELDVDGYRISVVERPMEKLLEVDPDFQYTIRITKLAEKPKDTWRPRTVEELGVAFAAMKAGTPRTAYHGSEKVRADENLRKPATKPKGLSSEELADALRATIPVVEEMFNVPPPPTFGKERQKKAERQREQARYMASLRFLPARAKEAAKRIYREKGVKAATAYAQSVVRPKGKAK